jgi:hypothetical protein
MENSQDCTSNWIIERNGGNVRKGGRSVNPENCFQQVKKIQEDQRRGGRTVFSYNQNLAISYIWEAGIAQWYSAGLRSG